MKKIYQGEFLGIGGTCWGVTITRSVNDGSDTVETQPLTFDGDTPVELEWGTVDKEEPLQGASATIRVISPTDRAYIDLYTVADGDCTVLITRNGEAYWHGLLDPEQYEEPYESECGYTVTLTFADFGALDRLLFNGSGRMTLLDIVASSLERVCIPGDAISEMISTEAPDISDLRRGVLESDDRVLRLSDLEINIANFYDEDGEPSTLKEVIEGILQPLALKMVQRSGRIWVYDLHALYTQGPHRDIEWDGASQTLGVDKLYNSVELEFSPYASGIIYDGSIEYDRIKDCGSAGCLPVYKNRLPIDRRDPLGEPGFDAHWGLRYEGELPFSLNEWGQGTLGRIDSVNSGSDTACIFSVIAPVDRDGNKICAIGGIFVPYIVVNKEVWTYDQMTGSKIAPQTIIHCDGIPITKLPEETEKLPAIDNVIDLIGRPGVGSPPFGRLRGRMLKMSMDLLCDARYNPFEADTDNDKTDYARAQDWWNFLYVPIILVVRSEDGQVYHYTNSRLDGSAINPNNSGRSGGWRPGEGEWGEAFLYYYDKDNRSGKCGVDGWSKNKQPIAAHYTGKIGGSTSNLDGELIPVPPISGTMELIIGNGIHFVSEKGNVKDIYSNSPTETGRVYLPKWLGYKDIKIEMSDKYGNAIKPEDIVYSAWLTPDASDSLSIDTICGSANGSLIVGARGLLFYSASHRPVENLIRAGVTDHPEMLLIGTVYSQYAERRTVLSGEAAIECGGPAAYTERAQPQGRLFMLKGEAQDLRMECSESTFVELAPEQYEGLQIK